MKNQYYVRVNLFNAGAVGRAKPIATYKKQVPLRELGKWTQYKWAELLEETEWETIPKKFLNIGNYRTSTREGWKWEAIISGIASALPTVWSPEGGRITANYRRPIRKRKEVLK